MSRRNELGVYTNDQLLEQFKKSFLRHEDDMCESILSELEWRGIDIDDDLEHDEREWINQYEFHKNFYSYGYGSVGT